MTTPTHLLHDLDGETVARLYQEGDGEPTLTILSPTQAPLVLTGDAVYALHQLLTALSLRLPL